LLDNGSVLISGGCSTAGCGDVLASTEIHDAKDGFFKPGATMTPPRVCHAAIRLRDGRVLIAGGWTGDGVTATAEIFNPASGRFEAAGNMQVPRMSPVVVTLPDGRIVIIGGQSAVGVPSASAELFDPASATFSAAGTMHEPRGAHVAVVLRDGRVLVAGGHRARRDVMSSVEIFHPESRKFHRTGDMALPRHKHAAALLPDGRVLMIGGANADDGRGQYASTELFDPGSGKFAPGPDMHNARYKIPDAVVTLPSGAILVAGGARVSEIYNPDTRRFVPIREPLDTARMFATATLLKNGKVLVTGGYDNNIRPAATAQILAPAE
jgi:hypothetical protein